MGKYEQDAEELLHLIGGKENIAAVSHCITRMRFVLVNPKNADVEGIEAMKVSKGTFTQSGQFQVIIGNSVADFYNDFVKIAGVEGVSKDAVKQVAKKNQNVVQRVVAALAEIFAPLIPAIITGGLILGFRNCIDSICFFQNGTKTLCDISQFWAGMDSFLWLIGKAIFHMLPVGICWSVTKKMGTSQMLGIVLGLTLVSGQLLNAYSVAGTAAADIPKWDFGFVKVDMNGDGFEYLISQNQKVKAGTPLIRFDREKIKAAGHPDVTVCVITEEGNAKNIKMQTGIHADAKKTEIVSFE